MPFPFFLSAVNAATSLLCQPRAANYFET